MDGSTTERIRTNPRFQQLVQARSGFALTLSVAMLAIYFGFILIVAFAPGFLGTPIAAGAVTTIGIPIGLFVIVAAFVLTGIYVAKANSTFDEMNKKILEESLR
jgi:uncharacterized membrane protein (DUF485 family)